MGTVHTSFTLCLDGLHCAIHGATLENCPEVLIDVNAARCTATDRIISSTEKSAVVLKCPLDLSQSIDYNCFGNTVYQNTRSMSS